MAKKKAAVAYRPLDPDGDEYGDLFDKLVLIFGEHLGPNPAFSATSETHRFLMTYDSIMMDLWQRETAVDALHNLKRALTDLTSACEATPKLVLDVLPLNEEEIINLAKKKYSDETTKNLVFLSEIPLPKVRMATDALDNLYQHHEGLIQSIEMTMKSLPIGFTTRNRPLKEWALIQACPSSGFLEPMAA